MSSTENICVICAWRADCQKKFKVSGRDLKCPDFVKDLTMPRDEEGKKEENKSKQEKQDS